MHAVHNIELPFCVCARVFVLLHYPASPCQEPVFRFCASTLQLLVTSSALVVRPAAEAGSVTQLSGQYRLECDANQGKLRKVWFGAEGCGAHGLKSAACLW